MSKINFEGDAVANVEQTGLESVAELKLAEGMQDMGAGGLLCASYEVVHRGREKTNSKNTIRYGGNISRSVDPFLDVKNDFK